MAKSRSNIKPVSLASKTFSNGKFLPVYFFFGDDSFSLETILTSLEKAVQPLITSEFDKEVFHGEDRNLIDILDFASAFPFGSGKKLIIVKEFDKLKDKKNLTSYVNSPADFTILVLINYGSIPRSDSEPYKSLIKNDFIFLHSLWSGEICHAGWAGVIPSGISR